MKDIKDKVEEEYYSHIEVYRAVDNIYMLNIPVKIYVMY